MEILLLVAIVIVAFKTVQRRLERRRLLARLHRLCNPRSQSGAEILERQNVA